MKVIVGGAGEGGLRKEAQTMGGCYIHLDVEDSGPSLAEEFEPRRQEVSLCLETQEKSNRKPCVNFTG